VAFGAGIAVYFTADHEPMLVAAAPLAIALCGAAVVLRRQRYFPVLVLIAAAAAGFATATFRTAWIAHSVLTRPLYDVSLSGFVETRDIRERTDRFVLRVTDMALPRGDISLARVQLSVRKGTAPDAGDRADRNQGRVKDLLHRRPSTMRRGMVVSVEGKIFDLVVAGIVRSEVVEILGERARNSAGAGPPRALPLSVLRWGSQCE
jgi:competence protein ComEC